MPPKRRTSTKETGKTKKVAKDLGNVIVPTRSSKRTRHIEPEQDEPEEELVAVVKIKTSRPPVSAPASAAPLSALAARRAAINAGLYKEPEVEVTADDTDEEEEEEEEENREGIEVLSATDEEEIVLRETLDEQTVVPISGAATPNDESLPSTPLQSSSKKIKVKIPQLMDFNSVSNFKATNENSCVVNQEDDTYLFIGLQSGEDIVFMGQVMAAPLYGSMTVAGAVISSGREVPKADEAKDDLLVSFYPVFSPRTHSLLRIGTAPIEKASIQSHYNVTEIDENLIEAVFDALKGEFESILVIKDLEGITGLENMSDAVNVIPKNLVKFNRKEAIRENKLEINFLPGFHPILDITAGVKAFKIESSWEARTNIALEKATVRATPVVSVVCGGKDLGKSSYCRYLINRLLTKYRRVAYVETDVGQSEFTPPGLLSLHYLTNPILGPPFTHQQIEAERSFFFGSTSPRSDPDYYLECINELIDHYRHDQEKFCGEEESEWIPLIVNTQGWISGVGYNLLISQIQKLEPTDIFTMRHHIHEYKNLPHTFTRDVLPIVTEAFKLEREAPDLHYLDCVLQDPNVVTMMDNFMAVQQRDITLSSYFHQQGMGQEHHLNPQWDYKTHLIERIPYVIDWRQSLNAVWVIYEEVKLEGLFYALNGSLVGLIGDVIAYKSENGPKNEVTSDEFTPPTYFNTQDQPAPAPRMTTCHGFGIVRAIDPSRHALLLLTPVPASTLEKVSGIIKGELQLPLWTMLDRRLEKGNGVANVPWKKVPYITQESTEGAGANALRVRRNLLRRSQ